MKNLRILFTLLCLLVASATVKAADVTGALTNVADPKITYQSVDANNNPITLSARLYYKDNKEVAFIVLNNHPTITHNAGCPTGSAPQMEAIKYMISENALVICPDYIGFGETKGTVHPYMCATLTARNVLDCYKAAINYVKTTGGRTISKDYYTINIGYSQGGAVALAFQRYLETKATEADRKLVNLAGSVCGAGPYDQNILFDEYEKMGTLDYPVLMLYVLRGHKEAFGQTTMRDLELQECFTPGFWAYYNNTLKGMMDNKEKNVDEINAAIKAAGFTTFSSIMSEDYFNHDSKVYRIIRKTLEQSNLLAAGWTPNAPITFYHDKAGHDIVVPYAETVAARTRFAGHCTYVDAIADYGYDIDYSGWFGAATTKKENYLWHPAVFRETWGDGSKNVGQGTIKTLAGITGNESYKFSDLDHRTFGARFYAQFLAKRAALRPKTSSEGTAHNTNIAPAAPANEATLAITTSAAPATTYDKATLTLGTDIPYGSDQLTFVTFPAKVDGFWFGYNAPRYKVTLNAQGEAEAYTSMAEFDDFEPGKVYLVSPTVATACNDIRVFEAGYALPTKSYNYLWNEINIRTLNAFGGKSYATACLPFAYESNVAYAGKVDGDYINLTAAAEVPAGKGIVLVSDDAVTTAYLKPIFTTSASVDTDIRGTYTTLANNGYLTFGRNSAKTEVGFYKYSGTTLKPFSCYLEAPASSNALALRFIDDAITAIDHATTNGEPAVIYTIDGKRVNTLQSGTNIIRMTNGQVKKVIIK